ncbi:Internal alternative NAD(P)H-ubiquinone oxidoreductase A1, mitochondrial [Bulinus truncatus]|nr:Internal alternative NAD(P)H-ubiquinone oxidoreductase A1, mitochondrial [Bulinus truncatus]
MRKKLLQMKEITKKLRSFSTAASDDKLVKRKSLVILGTGWSGYSILKTIDKKLYDVIVVSPRNHFLFTPLLASTTVGTLEFRSIIEPVRNTGFRDSTHYHLSYATRLDPDAQKIHCTSVLKPSHQYPLHYDALVIGVGAFTNTFGVPGVQEHAFFLKDVVRLYKQKTDDIRVTLVESNKILSSFDSRLQAFAEKKIRQRKGFTIVQSSVVEVTADSVKLKDGSVIPCGLVVWSTGLAPREFTKSLKYSKNKSGQILTDRYLRVKDEQKKNVYAIGDCGDIEEMSLPCTAQVAEREGRYLAKFLNSSCNEDQIGPFKFQSLGMLAYIGRYQGLSDTPQLKFKGVASWFLWRSAYLTRLGSWRLRMQVPLDWTKTLMFGRDTSRVE